MRMEGSILEQQKCNKWQGGKVEGGSVTEAEAGIRKTVGVVQV